MAEKTAASQFCMLSSNREKHCQQLSTAFVRTQVRSFSSRNAKLRSLASSKQAPTTKPQAGACRSLYRPRCSQSLTFSPCIELRITLPAYFRTRQGSPDTRSRWFEDGKILDSPVTAQNNEPEQQRSLQYNKRRNGTKQSKGAYDTDVWEANVPGARVCGTYWGVTANTENADSG